ncbi:hypothetical protein LCGC14_1247170 [marine sediment metagenome]|uniref:Uncharacterized protein n=1 Tax=marine sediment metagenome TaxID=412755 RepID=A0A0F9LR23_9ZZZZ
MVIYCNSKKHTLEIEGGEPITLEEVKQLASENKITDCNIGLQRLQSFDWDWDKLDQFYDDCDNVR